MTDSSVIFAALKPPLMAVLIAAALTTACASMSATPEEVIRARATQNWNARIAGDFDSAYKFMPPSFRAVTPLVNYKNGFGGAVQWKSAEVVSAECPSQDKCLAH